MKQILQAKNYFYHLMNGRRESRVEEKSNGEEKLWWNSHENLKYDAYRNPVY